MRRRDFLLSASVTVLGGAGAACGSAGASKSIDKHNLPGYFSQFHTEDEPNADLSKIAWPSYVTKADPEVKTLYEFQLTHGELMRYMPCYCGCGKHSGHKSNRDCYVQKVNADGSAVLDSMAPTWIICMGVTREVMKLDAEGKTPYQIRSVVDQKYIQYIQDATPTPYPPKAWCLTPDLAEDAE